MLQRRLPRYIYPLFCTLLIVAATFVTYRIATTTAFDVHPDEVNHADGFCYYETHWWPPPLNASGLRYSPYGMSRLHEEEIVYFLFGKIAALLRPALEPLYAPVNEPIIERPNRIYFPYIGAPDYCILAWHTYRLLNVALLLVTLPFLFWMGKRYRWATHLALLILSIPLVVYLYGYDNSDGWGLSISACLILLALNYHERQRLTGRDALYLGLLTGLVLLSKRPYWLALPLAYLILADKALKMWRTDPAALNGGKNEAALNGGADTTIPNGEASNTGASNRADLWRLMRSWLPIVLVVAFILILPQKIIYPLSQGDYSEGVRYMREQRASYQLRPSHASGGYLLYDRGFPFSTILADPMWWRLSYESFYGYFGYWLLPAPAWVYRSAGFLLLLAIVATYVDFLRRRAAYSSLMRLILVVAPLLCVGIVVASLLYSWLFDAQPQGRYLVSALLPLAFLVGGVAADEPIALRWIRRVIWPLLIGMSFYALWEVLLVAPVWRH